MSAKWLNYNMFLPGWPRRPIKTAQGELKVLSPSVKYDLGETRRAEPLKSGAGPADIKIRNLEGYGHKGLPETFSACPEASR